MKGSFRRMFTFLLLVAIGTSWIFGTVVLRRFHGIPLRNSGMTRLKPEHSDLDTTLHKLAEIDLGEDQMKQEVDKLFENKNPRGSRSLWSQFPNVNIQLRSTTGRINLNDPMFHRIWLDFRELLGGWFRNKRFQPEVMSELINLVKHPIDEYHSFVDVSNRRYSSCAVVGNSGILLKTEYGDLIDSHEVVIRLNNARIEGYERNVGLKTSISFINSNILHHCGRRVGCSCHPYGKKVPTLVYTCQALHFMDYLLCNSPYKAPLLVTDARFDVLCARIVKYYSLRRFVEETGKAPEEWSFAHTGSNFHYSSGMQAIMLALGICDSVSIFGFGKSTTAKHHYHTNQKSELLMHDYEAEYAFYHDLIKKPRVIPFLMENFTIPSVVLHH